MKNTSEVSNGTSLQSCRFVFCKQLCISKNAYNIMIRTSCQKRSNFLFYHIVIFLLGNKSREVLVLLHILEDNLDLEVA